MVWCGLVLVGLVWCGPVLVVAAGVTLYEALKAADMLASKGVNIRVIDPFTIKPIDIAAIRENAAACGGRVLTVRSLHFTDFYFCNH